MKHYITFCELLNEVPLTLLKKNRGVCIYGCFLKWWYPHFTPQNGKPMGLLGKPTILGNPHICKQKWPRIPSPRRRPSNPTPRRPAQGISLSSMARVSVPRKPLTPEDDPPGNGYISHQNGKFGKSSSSKVP